MESFVVVESPFATSELQVGDSVLTIHQDVNIEYARACCRDVFRQGEAPFASHILYTQEGILDDAVPAERKRGIEAGFIIGQFAKKRVFYVDRGFTDGMRKGLVEARRLGQVCEVRRLGGRWELGWDVIKTVDDLAAL